MKELKEDIIEAVQDAIDTVDGTVSIPILDHFLDEILTDQFNIADVRKPLYLDDILIELYSNDNDEDYRIDISISNMNGVAVLNKEQALKMYAYLGTSLNVV